MIHPRVSDRATTLLAFFARRGYRYIEAGILQPADMFLDLSCEDFRHQVFLTQDLDGNELCLRPDHTIPVCRDYLAERESDLADALCYLGPVFRQRAGKAGEFPQAGVELFGRTDREAADAEIIALGYEALATLGITTPSIRMGDIGLLHAMLDALGISPLQRRSILRCISGGHALPDAQAAPGTNPAGMLTPFEGQDPAVTRSFVEDILSIAGISIVGGRSASEIAERYLRRAADRDGSVLSEEQRALLTRYLEIEGDPDNAANAVRELAREAGLKLDAPLDSFEARTGFIAARGLDINTITFATKFTRQPDYYTGFVIEFQDSSQPSQHPVLGGGRYDDLLTQLGAPEPVPAAGFAIWLDGLDTGYGA